MQTVMIDPERHSDSLRVGVAQIAPRLGDVEANLDEHVRLVREAADHGCDLLVFPELSLVGYFVRDLVSELAMSGVRDGGPLSRLAHHCQDLVCVVGGVLESRGHRFYNASLTVSHGQLLGAHRKVYLPTYGMFDEGRFFAAGDSFAVQELPEHRLVAPAWRMGTLLCEDAWHPSAAVALARQDMDLLLVQSASPGRGVHGDGFGTEADYEAMLQTYARLFTCFVVYANRVGAEEGMLFWGGSRVYGPDGAMLGCLDDEPGLLVCDLDREALRRSRIVLPLLRDERTDIALGRT